MLILNEKNALTVMGPKLKIVENSMACTDKKYL